MNPNFTNEIFQEKPKQNTEQHAKRNPVLLQML